MDLDIRHVPSLPRLAWCARVGGGEALVWAGPWVASGPGWFGEGAWNGPFTEGELDRATFLAGSGGVIRGDRLVVCAPSHSLEHLYACRAGDRTFVSNSLAFLTIAARRPVDRDYPNYFFDLSDARRRGVRPRPHRIHGGIEVHTAVNLSLDASGDFVYETKPAPAPPRDFESVHRLLVSTMESLLANAADPNRPCRHRPIVSLSRGYDSLAVAAMARQLGCCEAVTSVDEEVPGDRAAPLGVSLGIDVHEYPRRPPRDLAVPAVGEFLAGPGAGVDIPKAIMAAQLEGSLLLVGNDGDLVFSTRPGMLPGYGSATTMTGGGGSYLEFRLRIGMLLVPVPAIVSLFPSEMLSIGRSVEMRPWSVGGDYDRPIPRRIAEEAGVPSDQFGQGKAASGHWFLYRHGFPEAAAGDFAAWMNRHAPPSPRGGRLDPTRRKVAKRWMAWLMGGFKSLPAWLHGALRAVALRPWWHRAHALWGSQYLFAFHWAIETVGDRYRVPPIVGPPVGQLPSEPGPSDTA